MRLCRDASARLFQHAGSLLPDPLAGIHDIAGFEVLAVDGHRIGHASHDPLKLFKKGEGTYYPAGHFYPLDLRRQTLRHLALCDQVYRRKEHDMRAIKQIGTATGGVMIRRVTYTDPDSGTTYEFLTNEMTLRPGVIALLYRMRWDIEPEPQAEMDGEKIISSCRQKVFNELKNKLHQTKAWLTN